MKIFKINDKVQIVCEWKKTRIAFKHVSTLIVNGREVDSTKICYQNRTWEQYEFQSVIHKLLEKTNVITKEEKELARKKFDGTDGYDGEGCRGDLAGLKSVAIVAALGDIFGKTQKESNDWKARMLKAGLGDKGLSMPDDWDALDEATKEARLNGAIAQLK